MKDELGIGKILGTLLVTFVISLVLSLLLPFRFVSIFAILTLVALAATLRRIYGEEVTLGAKWLKTGFWMAIGIITFFSIRFLAGQAFGIFFVDVVDKWKTAGGRQGVFWGREADLSIIWEIAFVFITAGLVYLASKSGLAKVVLATIFITTFAVATVKLTLPTYAETWPSKGELDQEFAKQGITGYLRSKLDGVRLCPHLPLYEVTSKQPWRELPENPDCRIAVRTSSAFWEADTVDHTGWMELCFDGACYRGKAEEHISLPSAPTRFTIRANRPVIVKLKGARPPRSERKSGRESSEKPVALSRTPRCLTIAENPALSEIRTPMPVDLEGHCLEFTPGEGWEYEFVLDEGAYQIKPAGTQAFRRLPRGEPFFVRNVPGQTSVLRGSGKISLHPHPVK